MSCLNVMFYGLLTDAEALRAKGSHPVNARMTSAGAMTLRLRHRATLVADPAGALPGFMIGLSHPEIEALCAEPSVADHRPEVVIAQLADSSLIAAFCFDLPAFAEAAAPNPEYAEKRQGGCFPF